MEDKSTTKEFLQLCHKQVVEPALENGLDEECYYRYLSEIYRALTCDSGVRRKYHKMLDEAWENLIVKFNSDCDKVWVHCYEVIFRRQINFMIELGDFACASVKDQATYGLARGILNFIKLQLHDQKRFLDGVEDGISKETSATDVKKRRERHFTAVDNYEFALSFMMGVEERLKGFNY